MNSAYTENTTTTQDIKHNESVQPCLLKMPFTKSLKSLSRKMDGRLLTIHTLYRQELSNFTSTWLGAEKVVVAEKDGQKIAVEIKSFIGPSKISQFYTALGQFISYRAALQQ